MQRQSVLRGFGALCLGLIGAGLLSACTRYPEPMRFLAMRHIDPPTADRFTVCHGYDCTYHTTIVFTAEDWRQVLAPLESPAEDAATERVHIALAIAQFETIVGTRTGTDRDIGGLRFKPAGDASQMDCIDETTNTTTYLTLLDSRGKLHWNKPGRPATRGVFLDGRWYHETAVLVDIATGLEFAVDSWMEDNGRPPHILPLDDWSLSWNYS